MLITEANPRDPDAAMLLERLSDILSNISGDGGQGSFNPDEMYEQGARFVIARDTSGQPLGCGAYRPLKSEIADVKRMLALPGTKGVGSAILRHLEVHAMGDGYKALWLETRLINNRAILFYERHGYQRIENFGKYAGRLAAVCFGKILTPNNG